MIKVKNGGEIHIFRVQGKNDQLARIKSMVRMSFRSCPEVFHFAYIDEEGDQIQITSDDDLQTIFQLENLQQQRKNGRIIKLTIREDQFDYVELSQSDEEERKNDSFQLLNSKENSQDGQLDSSQEISSLEVLNDQLSSLEEEKNIAGIASQNLAKIQRKCIEEAVREIEGKLVQAEVDKYLGVLFEEVCRKEQEELLRLEMQVKEQEELRIAYERQQMKIKMEQKKNEELAGMIEKSLQKLMPSFIDKLTIQTVKNVKKILNNQEPSSSHQQ